LSCNALEKHSCVRRRKVAIASIAIEQGSLSVVSPRWYPSECRSREGSTKAHARCKLCQCLLK
jgi:hypothetical protein